MDITPVVGAEFQLVNGYGDGGFTIATVRYDGSVLVLPRQTLAWPVTDFAALGEDDFKPLIDAAPRPAILILGSGRGMRPLAGALRMSLRMHGIVVETMDTGAACRTYNVLLTEGRDVAGAFLAV